MSWGITLGKPRTQNANRQNSACFLPAKRLVFFFQAKARVVDRVVSFAAVFWECHAGGALRDIPTAKGSERQARDMEPLGRYLLFTFSSHKTSDGKKNKLKS